MKRFNVLFAVIIVLLLSFTNNDEFDKVVSQASSQTVKNKLRQFERGGIEKAVNTSNYDTDKIIAYAKTYIGTKHKMGGTTKSGIDCSGLVMVVHQKYGVLLPHSSHEQGRYGKIVSDSPQVGDLVFFYNTYSSKNFITHSGIYVGNNQFIHTSSSKGVIISSMNSSYWKDKYLFATRLK